MMLVVLWLVLSAAAEERNSTPPSVVYRNLEAAKTSGLLELVSSLPMCLYEMRGDSVVGRRQLGVVGAELERLVPSAVRIRQVLNADDVAVVDENALFSLGVGAAQELARLQREAREALSDVERGATSATRRFDVIRERLEALADKGDERSVEEERERAEAVRGDERAAEARALEAKKQRSRREEWVREKQRDEDQRERARQADEDREAREEVSRRFEVRRESAARREATRRKTDAALVEQQLQDDSLLEDQRRMDELKRVEEEAKAKEAVERENEDLVLRALRASMDEQRKKVLEAIELIALFLARGAAALFDDLQMLATTVAALVLLVGGGFFAKEAAAFARSLAEAYLGRPRLVRETSRKRFVRTQYFLKMIIFGLLLKGPVVLVSKNLVFLWCPAVFRTFKRRVFLYWQLLIIRDKLKRQDIHQRFVDAQLAFEAARSARVDSEKREIAAKHLQEESHFLEKVILADSIRERVLQLGIATRNAKRNGAPFRHLLLHGPPGTGKTLVARRLAKASGLEYALMSGGDVGPLGADGVTALHALFRWARSSASGVLLFVDEAEAFLATRARTTLTEDMRNTLNAFLYQTGSPTLSFVLVLATNRANDLDPAVLDRVDETIYFDLPDLPERRSLVSLYYEAYVASLAATKGKHTKEHGAIVQRLLGLPSPLAIDPDVDDATLALVAEKTDTFSGREIEKLMVCVQSVAYGRDGALDRETLLGVVDLKADEHQRKLHFDEDDDHKNHEDEDNTREGGKNVVEAQLDLDRKTDDIIARMNLCDGFLAELLFSSS